MPPRRAERAGFAAHAATAAWAGLAASALALAACGGGGGEGGSGGPLSATAPIFVAARAASAPEPTGDNATDAFQAVNHLRKRLGLSAFIRSAALDLSAQRHASYYVQNGISGAGAAGYHNEIPGRPGFSGVTVTDRARAAGYDGSPVQENMSIGTSSGAGSAAGLTAVPYHRINMLSCHAEIGVAEVSRVYTLDFGGTAAQCGPAADQLVAYPFPDQDDVPIGTFSSEIPNPLPDIKPRQVGYPISLLAHPGVSLELLSLTVTDARGQGIPGRIVSTNTENGAPLGNYAFFMPLPESSTGMFDWDTQYTVQAAGRFNGAAFALTWRFKTGRP